MKMSNIYLKSELHADEIAKFLDKFKKKDIFKDVEYGTLAYIAGATYKTDDILQCFDDTNTIDLDMIHDKIEFYSATEKVMIRFALQCFNPALDEIPLNKVMRFLDDKNTSVIVQAIKIRYGA